MSIQALKVLVIGMGMLIVVGVTVMVVTVINRVQERATASPPPARIAVTIPEGARLMAAVPDGERLVLRLETADGPQVLVVDLASGEIVVTVVLQP